MPFVSTGKLPPRTDVRALLQRTHNDLRGTTTGVNSSVYPALEHADPQLFGISLRTTSAHAHDVGDVAVPFVVMSVSKPFVFALLCADLGSGAAAAKIGLNATGRPFNAVDPVMDGDGRTNPMVNPGAIATTSHIRGTDHDERWQRIRAVLSAFAGHDLLLDDATYASVVATNLRNRVIAAALAERGLLGCAPDEALDLYNLQCCLTVTAHDLAVMGATLANGGRNPVTGERVIDAAHCHHVLASMLTAGLYEDSGSWLYHVGLPAKSGISGGIVAVSPGKGALGLYSPPLDSTGNSVRGVAAATSLSIDLGMDLLASSPADPAPRAD